ncbi:PspC domain-containing protein [Nocardioides sp.]|uniref:PspC domain-containing protein n=1 Tax=Nocardioides sp. TaxID=35761 RepID=UPI0026377E6A|nr:PspC domain-containing protein [Nocardioides sp.]MDI6911818.1 PspC domain-containing protein [Nocardioides sp.]
MTTTPPEAPSDPQPQHPTGSTGPRVDRDQVRDLGRLRRSVTDRKVAGVAGGLGRHLDIDPLILRVAFVVLVFFGGAGLILYGACWLLVPEDGAVRAPFNLDERSRSVALVIVGVIAALALIGDSWGAFWFPWPLAIIALVVLWLLTRNNPPRPVPPVTPGPPPAQPTYHQPAPAPAQPTYAQPTYAVPPPAYVPPTYVPPATYVPRPPNPRKRGPILFWFTLALIALAEGVLGMIDLAGTGVADAAYPALAVGISGLMLVVGAFFGRAGGIIALGLLATVVLTGVTAADRWDGDEVIETPPTAAAVDDRYWLGAGEQVIDLREVADLDRLDGRTIEIEGGIGHIEVILPDGLAATVQADVDGPGNIKVFDLERGGIDTTLNSFDGSQLDPEITIDAQLGVGQIEVHR